MCVVLDGCSHETIWRESDVRAFRFSHRQEERLVNVGFGHGLTEIKSLIFKLHLQQTESSIEPALSAAPHQYTELFC